MAHRSLDTGEFNEYGEWKSYKAAQVAKRGPSPFPLLAILMLIAALMLLRFEHEPQPRIFGAATVVETEAR